MRCPQPVFWGRTSWVCRVRRYLFCSLLEGKAAVVCGVGGEEAVVGRAVEGEAHHLLPVPGAGNRQQAP